MSSNSKLPIFIAMFIACLLLCASFAVVEGSKSKVSKDKKAAAKSKKHSLPPSPIIQPSPSAGNKTTKHVSDDHYLQRNDMHVHS